MACGCQSKGKPVYAVRLNGKTVYSSTTESIAITVNERYKSQGSKVVKVPPGSTAEAEERKGA